MCTVYNIIYYIYTCMVFFNLPRLMMTINGSRAAVVAVIIIYSVVLILLFYVKCTEWMGIKTLDQLKQKQKSIWINFVDPSKPDNKM